MNLDISSKQAVVCGSTQGIGKAIAIELAELGASVTLVARNPESLESVKSLLDTNQGQQHNSIIADFGQPAELKIKLEAFLRQGYKPEILINNTGGPSGGAIIDESFEKFEQTIQAHLHSSHILVQAIVPFMKEKNYGRIINVISTSVKQPIPGLGVSNTIRGAMSSWAKTLSFELAQFGITVNNILPGYIQTQRLDYVIDTMAQKSGKTRTEVIADLENEIPAKRIGEASELAALAAFLASPAASYINGTSIPVDGGKTTAF